ncbi:hypothetical protein [Massilia phosphatilytica]
MPAAEPSTIRRATCSTGARPRCGRRAVIGVAVGPGLTSTTFNALPLPARRRCRPCA